MKTFLSAEDQSRYEILEQLGQGSFAVVFKAKDQSCQREVAIKVLRHCASADLCERFFREVKVCLELRHPNIVSMYDANFDVDPPYLIMEYVEAEDLSDNLLRCDISVEKALSITRQIGKALSNLHEKGLLHRDVKPENILIEKNGRAVLTDFNLVYVENATVLTKTGQIVGTPNYIPPEQWYGGLPNVQGDIYALGRVFYEMLTCTNKEEVLRRQKLNTDEPYPSPTDINGQVSRALSGVVLKAVAPNPTERYASIEEFLAALDGLKESTSTVELPQRVKIKSENELRAHKAQKSMRWLQIAVTLFICSLLLSFVTWMKMRPQLPPPKLSFLEPSILGVVLRFENCIDKSYKVTVKTADGKHRWHKTDLIPTKESVQTIVPWKDWTPQGMLEATGSHSRSLVTTCAALARFKLGKAKVRYVRKAVLVEWPCTHELNGEATLICHGGKTISRKTKFRQKKLIVWIPLNQLKRGSIKVHLRLTDITGHTLETEQTEVKQLDLMSFFAKLQAFKKRTKGIAGLQKKVANCVLNNSELSSVERLKTGMPKGQLVADFRAESLAFKKATEGIIEAEMLLLSSPSFKRSQKLRLFNAFTFLQEMDRALYVFGSEPVFRKAGFRRLGNFVRLRGGRSYKHPVHRDEETVNIYQGELPLIAVLTGHMRGIREQFVSATINREKADQVSLDFDLSHDWLATCGGKVGLCIRASIEEHSYLRLVLNDKLHLVLWTERVKSRKTRGILNRELHVPKWILNKGKNTLALSHIAILPRIERLAVLKLVKLLPTKFIGRRKRRN